MNQSTGEALLLQGQQLREQGSPLEALDFLGKALDAFAKEDNLSRFAHTLLDRAICWQHLYQFNGNFHGFLALHKNEAKAMLELVTYNNITEELADAYFINAKAKMMSEQYEDAIELFEKAIEHVKTSAQKGDWKTNLGKALYLSGQKEHGVREILKGIELVKEHPSEADYYNSQVWVSGGYLRLAEILREDDPEESKKYLILAEEIINTDPKKFCVRKAQLENLVKNGVSGL